MSGLKSGEWQLWDSENLNQQERVVEKNVQDLLNHLLEKGLNRDIHSKLKDRYNNWKISSSAAERIATTKNIFELQKDLGALLVLLDNGFDFSCYPNNTNYYQLAQEFIRWKQSPTDVAIQFSQMVHDAINVIETDGFQPPAKMMQTFEQYQRQKQSITQIDDVMSNPEEKAFYGFVDTLREKVGNNYDANLEIDRILTLTLNYGQKITEFHSSEILKPYLN